MSEPFKVGDVVVVVDVQGVPLRSTIVRSIVSTAAGTSVLTIGSVRWTPDGAGDDGYRIRHREASDPTSVDHHLRWRDLATVARTIAKSAYRFDLFSDTLGPDIGVFFDILDRVRDRIAKREALAKRASIERVVEGAVTAMRRGAAAGPGAGCITSVRRDGDPR